MALASLRLTALTQERGLKSLRLSRSTDSREGGDAAKRKRCQPYLFDGGIAKYSSVSLYKAERKEEIKPKGHQNLSGQEK